MGEHQRSWQALRQWPWPCDLGEMNRSVFYPIALGFLRGKKDHLAALGILNPVVLRTSAEIASA
jgi:hypothetical protein